MLVNNLGFNYYDLQIDTAGLALRMLHEGDCAAWIRARQNNYDHLQKWEPVWDMDHTSYIGFNRLLSDTKAAFSSGNYYGFVIIERKTASLIGHIEVSNILSWPKNSATIGYWMCGDKQGHGYMTEAVRSVCIWALQKLSIVKLEAGTMASNERSQNVLKRVGFRQEGYSHSYGEIDGTFTDHVLWGAVAKDIMENLPNIPYDGDKLSSPQNNTYTQNYI